MVDPNAVYVVALLYEYARVLFPLPTATKVDNSDAPAETTTFPL